MNIKIPTDTEDGIESYPFRSITSRIYDKLLTYTGHLDRLDTTETLSLMSINQNISSVSWLRVDLKALRTGLRQVDVLSETFDRKLFLKKGRWGVLGTSMTQQGHILEKSKIVPKNVRNEAWD